MKKSKSGQFVGTSRFRKLRRCYFFSSFLGLHFSQTLPSFLALMQHSCEHSLPAAFAFSQQVSARAKLTGTMNAAAQSRATNDFIDFICFPFLPALPAL